MNKLPYDSKWNKLAGSDPWYTSHGSPSVSPNNIWMWSYGGRGEGMNLKYHFQK